MINKHNTNDYSTYSNACYFLLYTHEECIGFTKIFDIRFSMDLHVLRCPEHNLTIFRKCLSVDPSACMSPKFCGHSQELSRGN